MKTNPAFRFTLFLVALAALLAPPAARAATVTWNGTTGGDWNLATNWSGSAKPGASDTALFNTTLATVANAAANQSVGSIAFDTNAGTASGAFTIGTTGGSRLTLGNNGIIQILSTLSGTGKTISINSPIVLTPNAVATVGTYVSGGPGTYTFANYSSDATNTLNLGGTISAATTQSTETLVLAGTNTGANTISGVISTGSAALFNLRKDGAGTWILSGNNTYTGTTLVTGGLLQLTAVETAGTSGPLGKPGTLANSIILQGGGLKFTATNTYDYTTSSRLQLGDGFASTIDTNGQSVTFANALGVGSLKTGGLTKAGLGTLTLNGTNTFTGNTTVSAGTLYLTNSLALQSSALDTLNSVAGDGSNGLKTNQTTLTLGGLIGNKDLASVFTTTSGGYSSVTGLTLNPSAGISNSYSGVIANGAAVTTLTKSGAGTQILSGANSYTGTTTVSVGVLNIQNATALGTTANGTSVTSGAALQIQGNATVGAETLALNGNGTANDGALRNISGTNVWQGTVTLGSAARINSDSGSLTFNTAANSITGTQNLWLGGAGNGTIAGTITTSTGTLTKDGAGTWTLSGNNTFTGTTSSNAGVLSLDFSAATTANNIINYAANSSALALGGGTLNLLGSATAPNSQRFNGLTVNAGASAIALSTNATPQALLLTLGAITRNTGGTVDFTEPTGTLGATNGATTTTTNTNGILGGWATVGGTDWAYASGTTPFNIIALPAGNYTSDTWGSGNNTTITGSSAVTANSTTNSLRFNATGANTLTLNGTNVITSGGILVTSAVGNNTTTITGGTLEGAASKDLVIIQNNTLNGLTIASTIANNTGATALTKSGAGALTLNATNTYTGGTYLNAGTLNINAAAALGTTAGTFTINGGTIDNTSGAAITTSNYVQTWNNDFAFTGASDGTHNLNLGTGAVTLGGPGASRTITVNSGNLTVGGNIANGTTANSIIKAGGGALTLNQSNNYFTGGVTLNAGTLNIGGQTINNSNSSLGGGILTINGGTIANTSGVGNILNTSTTGTTGLMNAVVVNGDFTFNGSGVIGANGVGTGDIVLQNFGNEANASTTLGGSGTARTITVNNGTLTIAEPLIGNLGFIKAGNGTLTLTRKTNTFTGNVTLNEGTLYLANAAALGAITNTLIINGGTINGGGPVGLNNYNQIWNNSFSTGTLNQSNVAVGDANTLDLGLGNVSLGGGNASLTITANSPYGMLSVGGTISNGTTCNSLIKEGPGMLNLYGANTFTGGMTVNAGTLLIGNAAALGTGTLTLNNGAALSTLQDMTIANNAQVWNGNVSFITTAPVATLGGSYSYGTGGTLNMGTGAITLGSNSSMTAASYGLTVGGSIGGSGYGITWITGVTGSSAPVITLTGASTYTGATVVQSQNGFGNVAMTTGTIANTTSVTVNAGGTFKVGTTGTGVVNRINSAASLTLGGNGGGFFQLVGSQNTTVNAQTFTSLNIGAGSNVLYTDQTSNISTITFSGASGSNYIRSVGGTLRYLELAGSFTNVPSGTGNVIGSGINAMLIGATYAASTNSVNASNFVIAASGNVTAVAGTADTYGSGVNTNLAAIPFSSPATTLTQSIRFDGNTALTLPGAFTVQSGGILATQNTTIPIRITGGTLATGLSGGDLWVVQGGTASATTGVVIGSQIVDYGTSALTKGGARALYLTNTNNTYAGGTYLGEGILNVASAGSLGSGALNFTGPGTLQAAGTVALGSRAVTIGTGVTATFDTNGNNITVGGVISGVNSGLNKFGQGTLTLTGANTYSGTTLVTDGTLKLDFSAAGAPTSNIINPASLLTTGGYQGLNLNGGGVRTNVATTATLSIQGKDNTANTQAFTGFSPLATQGSVAIGGGMTYMNFASGSGTGSLAVNMGGITYGGTAGSNSQGYNSNNGLDITTTGNVTVTTTSPTNGASGLINISQLTGFYQMGFVTFNKSSWATLSGNQVISMPNSSYAATAGSVSSTSGTHLDVTANATLTNNGDVGSDLRFNNTLNTPSLNATLTLSSVAPSQLAAGGSILVSGNVGAFDSTITGGYLAGNGRRALNIFQYNTAGSLVINSNIVNGAFNNSLSATGLSKFGAGNLTLTATNGYTGMTFVNEGTVLATGDYSATVIKACTLNTGTTVTVPDTTGIYVGQPVTGTGLGTGANYVTVVVTAIVGNTVTLSATNATPGASTLTFASGGALGGAYTGVYIGTSGTLQIGNGTTHGSLDPTNTINNLGSLVISRNDTNTFANTISGTVATNSLSGTANMNTLEIKGGGNTTLGYNGTVNGSAPGSSATYTLTAPGNVYAGMLVTGGNVTAGTTVSSVSGSTVTLSANTGGAVTNATFTTANTFAGTTKVSGGSTLTLGSALALGNSTLDYTQSYNGTFTFGTQTAVTLGGLKGDQNLALTNNAAAAVALNLGNNNIDTTYSGNLTGTGSSLTKTGIGTTILAGTNSYTGGTTISQGTLQLGSGSTSGNLSSTGAIVDNGNLTINRSNAVIQGVDFSGAAITGSGSFTQAGTGATTLNATNTFTGGVNLNAGTLNINKAAALGTVAGPFTINGGTIGNTSGTFIITSNYLQTWNNDFAFTGAGLTTAVYDLYMGTGAVSLGAGAGTSRTITVNSGTLAEGGIISNGATANSLIKAGAGALSLSGVNTFTGGVTLNNGTLNINNAAALGNATVSTFTIAGGALADTSGGAITTTNAQVWNGDFGFSTNRYLASALNAVNGGVNTVMYAEQALTLNGNATLGTAAGTTRTITSDGYYSNLTVGGIISDGNTAKGVTKAGTGLLTLNGANTFSGGVTLNAGTLQINAGAALGTGTLTITGGSLAPSANTTFSNNNAQVWNGAFSLRPLTSSSSYTLNMGNGAITLAGNSSVTDTIGALTVPGAIGDSGSNYGVTWVTGYSSTASTITLTGNNTYGGPTVVQSLNGSGSVQLTTGNLTNTSAVTVNGGGKFNVGTTGVGVTNRINPTASLTLGGNGGGSFVLLGSQNATVNRQTFASLNIGAGVNGLTTDQSSNISTITFNGASGTNYIRNVGGVVNFGLYSPNGAASFTNTVTGTGNISGSGANAILIGAYSMGNWLVGLSGGTSGTLVAATTTSSWGSGLNTAVAAGSTATGTVSQSLSFAGGVGGSLTLPGAFTVESGGILGSWQTTGMTTITGGSLKGRSSGDLWIAQCTDSGVDAVHGMIINSQILDNNTSSLTYGGGRALYLTNTNNTYAGGTYIGCGLLNNGNILNVASAGSLGTGAVNFTGAATLQAGGNADLGSRAVTIGTGVTATFDTNGNNVTVGGVISGVNSGLTKVGLGTLTLTGQNTYTGITSLRNGTLKLDFSASGAPTSNIINPNSLLSVSSFVNAIGTSDIAAQSDTLIIQGAANTANSQTFGTTPSPLGLMGSTSIGRGMTNMVFNAGSGTGTLNVNLGDIYRNYGYLDVSTTGSVTVSGVNPNTYGGAGITGYLNSFNSSTGGDVFATFNKSSWATVTASGNLTGMADSAYTTNNTGGMADITTSGTLPSGNNSAQTLRFNDTANTGVGKTVTLSTTAVSQLSYGGILVTAHVGAQDSTISGGFLAAVNNGRPLNIFQNNTSGNLVINSQIMDGWNPSLIAKNGAGTLILNGVNSNSSDFFVNEGKVIATGNYTASSVQTVVIPNGVAGSITVQVDDSSKLFVGQVLNISSLVVPNGGRQNVVTAIIDATHVTLTTSTASFTTNSTSGTFQSGGALGGYNYAGTSKTPIEYIANGATLQIGSAATGNSGGIYPAMQISNLGSFILSHSGNYTFGNQITGTVATNSISGTVGAGTTGLNTLEITGGGNTTLGSDMAVAGTALTGATTFVLGAQGNVYTGQNVTGTGFQAGTLVSYVDGLNVYLSKATTGNVTTGNFTTNGNTFNGATTITGNSTLILGSALALQNSTLLYNSADSGTFSFGTYTAATLGGLGGDKNLALTNNASAAVALTLGGNNFNTAYSGNLTGSGASLIKNGIGITTLSGTNSYSGGTTVNTGTLQIGSATGLGASSGNVTVAAGATLDLNATMTNTNPLTLNGGGFSIAALTNSSASPAVYAGTVAMASDTNIGGSNGTLTLNGIVSGTFNLSKVGTDTLIFGNVANTFGTGKTFTIVAGTVQLGNAASLGAATNAVSLRDGAALDLNGQSVANTNPLTINGTGIASGGALTNTSATGASYAGLITLGSASSIIASSGNITISNASTITGSTFGLTLGGAYNGSLASIIGTTTGTLTKQDAGTWTLSGTNTYTGKTIVQNGTLSFSVGNASATANQQLGANATLDLGVASTSSGTLNYTGAAGTLAKNINALGNGSDTIHNSGTGLLTLSGNLTKDGTKLTLNGGTYGITVTGVISGSSAGSDLVITGGTTTLTNLETYNGPTYIQGNGTLVNSRSGGALPTGTTLTIGGTDNTTGTFDLGGNAQTVTALNTQGTGGALNVVTNNGSSNATLTVTGGGTFAGMIQDGTKKTSLAVTGGTFILSSANTFTGNTTVSTGTLEAGAVNALATTSAITVTSSGTLLLSSGSTSNSTTLALEGGKVALKTGTSVSTSLGALTLTENSIIDFGLASSTNILNLGSATWTPGKTIQIWNWSGTPYFGGGTEQLMVSGKSGWEDNLSSISFYTDSGSSLIGGGGAMFAGYELVAVPEPATWSYMAAIALGGAVLLIRRRRLTGRLKF